MNSVKRRAALGYARLIVGMGILLFAPGGSLHFWQAWIYLGLFAGSTGLITAYLWKNDPKLLERRVNAGPGAEKQKSQKVIQVLASIAFIGVLVVPSMDHRFRWSHVPEYDVVAGDVLVAISFLIIFVVFKENTFTGGAIEVAPDQKVISTGPYAVVRHPMYLGALIMLFGTPLALGSSWGLLMFLPIAAVIICRLLEEEKFLREKLPGYNEYCRRVRHRLVPFVF